MSRVYNRNARQTHIQNKGNKMSNDTMVTFSGNLVSDPEMRFTNETGTAVANVSVACTPSVRNDKGEFVDGDTVYHNIVIWKTLAENFVESAHKGDRVVVFGRLVADIWEDEEGNKRTNYKVNVIDIGLSTQYATAVVSRTSKKAAPKTTSSKAKATAKR